MKRTIITIIALLTIGCDQLETNDLNNGQSIFEIEPTICNPNHTWLIYDNEGNRVPHAYGEITNCAFVSPFECEIELFSVKLLNGVLPGGVNAYRMDSGELAFDCSLLEYPDWACKIEGAPFTAEYIEPMECN